jgi:RNA polymerase sigma factor (sigma-70 family)
MATDEELLARTFEEQRTQLRAVAVRMLGSAAEADDAVQETWVRLHRTDTSAVDNLAAWLTTVVARVCLNMLRTQRNRREDAGPGAGVALEARPDPGSLDPEREALLADAVGPALLVVLESLTPAERLAFVLHDLFAVPFDEIAPILGRSGTAIRQLASRARRRVQGAPTAPTADAEWQRQVVAAFLAASRGDDFAGLVALLDPDAVVVPDQGAMAMGPVTETRGAEAVARVFAGRARAARLALVDGLPGAVFAIGGTPKVVFAFTLTSGAEGEGDRIATIDLIADPEVLAEIDVVRL